MKQTLFAGITIGKPLEVLEPYDGKLSRTVLRGEEGRKPLALPGFIVNYLTLPRIMHTTKQDYKEGRINRADWKKMY